MKKCWFFRFGLPTVLLAALPPATAAFADTTYQTLPFSQNWTNTSLLNVANNWSMVPGIVGYRGDDLTTGVDTDPQTILADGSGTPVSALVNQSAATSNTGAVGEFELTNPVVAFQGSGTADAPHLVLRLNLTGESQVSVSYLLRDIDSAADNAVQQVGLHYRVGGAGSYVNLPQGYVADASTGPNQATLETPVCVVLPPAVEGQAQVELRFMTTNASGSDEWIGVDNISVVAGVPCPPQLTIADVQVLEGDSGTSTATFTVSLSSPAPAGGVGFTIATGDSAPVSAVAGVDYTANQVVGATIPEGSSEYEFDVTITGDTTIESNETFLVSLSNITGSPLVVVDSVAVGTILNDDADPEEIEVIQGSAFTSPFVGQVVRSEDNIVTAVAANGFFIQTPEDRVDFDPQTSSGIFVFTNSAPTVAVGDQVDVVGLAEEDFGFTRIKAFGVSVDAAGLPLPSPVVFDAVTPSPNQPEVPTAWERYESMRIQVTGGAIGTGNQRFGSDPIAELWITAGSRAFREPGIEYPGVGGLPVWDGNPEIFELDQDRLGLPAPPILGGATFDAVGVLGFEFGGWELWPTSLTVTGGIVAEPVPVAAADELTIGSLNLYRMFDDVDDPGTQDDQEVLTTVEYQRRLAKFSLYIREQLRSPDVIGVQEVEQLSVLQALAAKIAVDDPTTVYTAYLVEGNDVGGIDVGFLVRQSRVTVAAVTQLAAAEIFSFPSFPDAFLHDRPPFLLDATFDDAGGQETPFSVLVVHQRSLSGIDAAGANGERVRQKRLEQAQSVAQIVQDLQTEVEAAPLVVIGDFNAYQFSDGYVDVIGQIRGDINPADSMLSGPDLVNPNLINLVMSLPEQERYSFLFDGSAQVLDHALITDAMVPFVRWFAYGRGNTDAAIDLIYDAGTALRSSDHDGFVLAIVGATIFADGFESGDTTAWSATVP